jgi:hypothetical protein
LYDELYAAWQFELENVALGGLPSDFYSRAADYVRSIKKEIKLIRKTLSQHFSSASWSAFNACFAS